MIGINGIWKIKRYLTTLILENQMNNKKEWMQTTWRPMMGWMYMITCITDFIIFPVLWSVLQSLQGGEVTSQWNPLTLQGAGLFHLAMGAVLGVAAWSRGQEKLAGLSSDSGYTMSRYNQNYHEVDRTHTSQHPIETGNVLMTAQGKPAPIFDEPEL
jgi:Cu/Ag efflux pump CusA